MTKRNYLLEQESLHTEYLQDIIKKPPSWLLKRGISFVLVTILLIIGLSFFIRFPDIVSSPLKFNTTNAPKPIVSRVNGELTRLLVNDGDLVKLHAPLAYLESTANHDQVIALLNRLKEFRTDESHIYNLEDIISPRELQLGELQGYYENFHRTYLNYKATNEDGVYLNNKRIIQEEVSNLRKQYARAVESFELQKAQLKLAETEFEKYSILAEKKIISPNELQQKEALLLTKKQTIPQMEGNLIAYQSSLLAKNKELSLIQSQIVDEQKNFVQALNSFISEAETWKRKYILLSSSEGKVIYASFLQEDQIIQTNQELFYINPASDQYYGEMVLPQNATSRVKKGQDVLIKVRSYPYQEYGFLRGKVNYISEIPIKDSLFFASVSIIRSAKDSIIKLKPGIYADAEILTDDRSIIKRIWYNLTKSLH